VDIDALDLDRSMHMTLLPSRAFLRSWLDQTLPARRAALEESVELHSEAVAEASMGSPTWPCSE
jgi:hypothetical protein